MDLGIGITETLLILALVLVLFGSRKAPEIIQQFAKFFAHLRAKISAVVSEIQEVAQPFPTPSAEWAANRKKIREDCRTRRREMPAEDILEKSRRIAERLCNDKLWNSAKSVCIYLSLPEEVQTDDIIHRAFLLEKRVAVPYLGLGKKEINLSEISSLDELETGAFGVREPKESNRRRFFKSDLDLVICPGLAFDRQGGRLGFGKGYYDSFLKELAGRIPIAAMAFDNQVQSGVLPFSYHDIPMNWIFTETETIACSRI